MARGIVNQKSDLRVTLSFIWSSNLSAHVWKTFLVIQAFLLAYQQILRLSSHLILHYVKHRGFSDLLITTGGSFIRPSMFEVNAMVILSMHFPLHNFVLEGLVWLQLVKEASLVHVEDIFVFKTRDGGI